MVERGAAPTGPFLWGAKLAACVAWRGRPRPACGDAGDRPVDGQRTRLIGQNLDHPARLGEYRVQRHDSAHGLAAEGRPAGPSESGPSAKKPVPAKRTAEGAATIR